MDDLRAIRSSEVRQNKLKCFQQAERNHELSTRIKKEQTKHSRNFYKQLPTEYDTVQASDALHSQSTTHSNLSNERETYSILKIDDQKMAFQPIPQSRFNILSVE